MKLKTFSQKLLNAAGYSVLIVGLPTLMAGCSSTPSSGQNAKEVLDYDADTDYRKTEKSLSQDLEVPPNLFAPAKRQDRFDVTLQNTANQTAQEEYRYVPTYRADNLSVKSNLSDRWLEIKGMSSEKVWDGTKAFLESLGMPIAEARKDTGFIRTEFVPRKELVPLDDQGPLTKLLNSWRPEQAEGLYDRLIAQVEFDKERQVTKIYFHHYMVADPDAAESANGSMVVSSGWRIRPYNPMVEAEAIYQSMIFFGASQEESLKAIESTEGLVSVEGEDEYEGLRVKADASETWSYLKAMLYRADWHYDRIKADTREVWVKVPEEARKENTLMSKLAFWRDDKEAGKYLPEIVKFSVTSLQEDGVTNGSLLKVEAPEGMEPLTAEKRHYIFQSLGLLAE
jgi:hypothetical protein